MKKEYIIYLIIGLLASYGIKEASDLKEVLTTLIQTAFFVFIVRWLKKEYWPESNK